MSYERKLERALQQLQAAKISNWNYNAPLHQWLRKAGIKLRPPYYVPFLRNVVVRFVEFFRLFPSFNIIAKHIERGSDLFKLIV